MNIEKIADRAMYKSENIVEGIHTLDAAIVKFEALVGKINGSGTGENEKGEDLNSKSLSELLDLIPEILDGFASIISRKTTSLEEALY